MDDAGFLTDDWLAACNAVLATAPPVADGHRLAVTELVPDAPEGAHRAVTLVADAEGVRLLAGEDPRATAWLTLALRDATALHDGALDPAAALAQGRVRVRGDLAAVVALASVLADAHERLRSR